jgi:hypothetical protein
LDANSAYLQGVEADSFSPCFKDSRASTGPRTLVTSLGHLFMCSTCSLQVQKPLFISRTVSDVIGLLETINTDKQLCIWRIRAMRLAHVGELAISRGPPLGPRDRSRFDPISCFQTWRSRLRGSDAPVIGPSTEALLKFVSNPSGLVPTLTGEPFQFAVESRLLIDGRGAPAGPHGAKLNQLARGGLDHRLREDRCSAAGALARGAVREYGSAFVTQPGKWCARTTRPCARLALFAVVEIVRESRPT